MARRDGRDDGPLHDINDDNLPQHSGLDDGPLHDINDDNLPQHSGLDDGPLHDINDDNLPRHSGLDDGPQHDVNDDRGGGRRGADDVLRGGDADDRLTGRVGDDHIDGGNGVDVSVYGGQRGSYGIEHLDDGSARIVLTGPNAHHLLEHVERLEFADRKVAYDLGAGEAGGNAARLVGAAFGADAVHDRPDYIGIGLRLFDAGDSLHDVAELAAKAMGLDDRAFVDTVYRNVVGTLPSHEVHDSFEHMLKGHGGNLSQADLLVLAANHDSTAQQIDLVGLSHSGVDFT